MPKARQTCTRCSMRRQKCDKQQPCSRCVAAGEGHRCSRVWVGGYDASVHRQYPKSDTKYRRKCSTTTISSPGRNSEDHPALHESKHGGSLQPPSLDSDSDGWSSEHDRRSVSGGCAEYDANFEDFLWSPDPLYRAMITDSSSAPFQEGPHGPPATDPALGNLPLVDDDGKPDHLGPRFRHQEITYLENCLPNGLQILQLVDYHEEKLLWYTHCYHGPTFRRELASALHTGGGRLSIRDLDFRWCALLFAILTSSLSCASESAAQKWGFTPEQRTAVSKKWHEAAMECLLLADYPSRPHPYSVQAILVLVGPSHILGWSHRHSFLLGEALKIAQNLGYHRLAYQPEPSQALVSDDTAISREVGRRIWWSLVSHDWSSIASYDMFSIDPTQFTTSRPQSYHCNHNHNEPDRLAELQNHVLDVVTVMVDFQVASTACSDPASEYQQVWKHDQRLRELSRRDQHLDDLSLPWGSWARQALRMKRAHKTLDVHRNFFDRSFRDSTYSWSRWASIEAAKTIIQDAQSAFDDPERPVIWTDQANLLVAGDTLGKDALRRGEEPEREEHLRLVRRAMELLGRYESSVLASRGHKLLSSYLQDPADEVISNPSLDWAQMASNGAASLSLEPGFRSQDHTPLPTPNTMTSSTMFGVHPPTHMNQVPRTSSIPLDPELVTCTTTSSYASYTSPAFDVPSISVDSATGDSSWMDMMTPLNQERLGIGNLLGFDDPYSGFPQH